MNPLDLWDRYKKYRCVSNELGLTIDVSRMTFDENFLTRMDQPIRKAMDAMQRLEQGEKANVDEDRMVGHYWLRGADLAPDPKIGRAINDAVSQVKEFAGKIHDGSIAPQRTDEFLVTLVVGIGGSALGPQFVNDALGGIDDAMLVRFLDNTDPDGIKRVLAELDETLDQTLTIVISKSGGTKETRNAMLEVATAYQNMGLDFARHAVAITSDGSELHQKATSEKWIQTFPMWDWVGGRTSETSVVGLLPAALQGLDIDGLLEGARQCDVVTRETDPLRNPAALLAMMWFSACDQCERHNMVVLPYRDRLLYLGRYLQQLVMESLGKSHDRSGNEVRQGLNVFGNKGSTDQHAYVQQLRDGRDDFFAIFIRVLHTEDASTIQVEEGVTSDDYLDAFWQGTRNALYENGRQSITVTLDRLDANSLGVLIALFERTVGLYAELIDVNAYDQPGVEAGKNAAGAVLELQHKVKGFLETSADAARNAESIAQAIGESEAVETVHYILNRMTDKERTFDHDG